MKIKHWMENNLPLQEGKVAIVTGSTSGIGLETARVLADLGAQVIMAVRDVSKGNRVATQIKKATGSEKVEVRELNLADLKSVRHFAAKVKVDFTRLDLLINNAGVMAPPYGKTTDGFELQFGVNHVGHFVLTMELMELLNATPGSRVVNVSSQAHRLGNLDFSDLHWERRKYNAWRAYGDSKLANLIFTFELARQFDEKKHSVMALAAHPGWSATHLQRHTPWMAFLNNYFAQSPLMGALPTLYAATALEARNGAYYGPQGFMQWRGLPIEVQPVARAKDRDTARKLWEIL